MIDGSSSKIARDMLALPSRARALGLANWSDRKCDDLDCNISLFFDKPAHHLCVYQFLLADRRIGVLALQIALHWHYDCSGALAVVFGLHYNSFSSDIGSKFCYSSSLLSDGKFNLLYMVWHMSFGVSFCRGLLLVAM